MPFDPFPDAFALFQGTGHHATVPATVQAAI